MAKGANVAKGDEVSFDPTHTADDGSPPVPTPDAPLHVRFEAPEVLVVDKPAGVPTAPLRGGETGTLANALLGRYPELAEVGLSAREPGLVHRLDTDTSGLLVVGRTPAAFEVLNEALKASRLSKRYLLLCAEEGLPDEGTIEFPISKHPKDQRRAYACVHPRDVARLRPRPASTQYRVVRRAGPWALVEADVSRALRHQIRAHFAAIEHPLVGDVLYGGAEIPGLHRHALHASRVTFAGEGGVPAFDVESPLPDELSALLTDQTPR
jgi:23S rRNA pseudouridine1911/1915/1917 synthase